LFKKTQNADSGGGGGGPLLLSSVDALKILEAYM